MSNITIKTIHQQVREASQLLQSDFIAIVPKKDNLYECHFIVSFVEVK